MSRAERIADMKNDVVAWRRDLHTHPELLYDVVRTAGVVADRLRSFGADEVVTGIGRTGVVGLIRGKIRGKDAGPVIGLRADMDALPIEEETNLPYRSATPGIMHACGHDGHTAMLLGAARYLAETRDFAGTAVVIFQPAEEGGAGAKAMLDDGLLDRFGIQEVYGMHNMPGMVPGSFAIRPGAMLAAADRFRIVIEGKGSHAAHPHEGVDSVVAASHLVLALQTIVARNVDPLKNAVVSVTTVNGGDAFNVLPQRVTLTGTVRTLDPAVRDLCEARLTALARTIPAALGATAEVEFWRGYPVTMNNPDATRFAADVARGVSGAVDTGIQPIMGAEDFSFMLEQRPGAFIFIGNGDSAGLHHPRYNFNDEIVTAGIAYWTSLVEERCAVQV
ncbi:M20 aminoacylase family protein [Chelatococcus asaccharovorans]|uniref:M20 aminoacylase family protein n=1 Tax=Chelatococcus asaccharovorans TaxID=28210 RepID=UPI00224C6C68|nr:M20 aminoacylase family protein [Chelatococcus asaccharovorans]CAH1659418.1 Hippurate hydrolase [Chelatococcus asaccharovorans]CAH1684189.1 Hippurate hydrolase [Chelatococcus asaccharovorans]